MYDVYFVKFLTIFVTKNVCIEFIAYFALLFNVKTLI